jgi:hypothetical protein
MDSFRQRSNKVIDLISNRMKSEAIGVFYWFRSLTGRYSTDQHPKFYNRLNRDAEGIKAPWQTN